MYQLKNKKNIVLILSLILLFQVADNYKIINIFKNELKSDKVYTTAIAKMGLKDPIWKIVEKDYKKINIYPIKNKPKDYTRIAFFASEKGLSTNFGYFSRINHRRLRLPYHPSVQDYLEVTPALGFFFSFTTNSF